jgi:hypothetical protein
MATGIWSDLIKDYIKKIGNCSPGRKNLPQSARRAQRRTISFLEKTEARWHEQMRSFTAEGLEEKFHM